MAIMITAKTVPPIKRPVYLVCHTSSQIIAAITASTMPMISI